jgi:hypothetical protein
MQQFLPEPSDEASFGMLEAFECFFEPEKRHKEAVA